MIGWPLAVHTFLLALKSEVAMQLNHGLAFIHGVGAIGLDFVVFLSGQADGKQTEQ